jgi:pentatricopeptide repeat protein
MANKAIDLFNEIKNPNEVIIVLLFNACAQVETQEALNLVKKVSSQIPKSFHSNHFLLTSLIDALMKCGNVNYAQSLFDTPTKKTLEMYGAMMKGNNYYIFLSIFNQTFFKGYIKNNQINKAIDLFNKIKEPSEIILNLLFNACAESRTNEALNLAKKVYKEMPKSFHSNLYLLTSLIDSLMKCGDVNYAQSLFDTLTTKTLEMYGAMMKGNNYFYI